MRELQKKGLLVIYVGELKYMLHVQAWGLYIVYAKKLETR